jgi:hypothetical protein
MAAPSITSLPEKTINTFLSKWNASNLPIQYTINNDKFPTGATVTNYYTQVLIYVNGALVATIKQLPDTSNNTKIDIQKYVQTALLLTPAYTGLNDTNASAEFYITGSEEYLDSSGVAQSNAITGGGSGVVHYASLSALQFGSLNGGNMYDYVLDSAKLDLTEWMTFFERGQLVDSSNFLLSLIVNEPGFDLQVVQYDINGVELDDTTIAISSNGLGVYRLNLDSVTFISTVNYITVQALVSVYGTAVSELFTIDIDDKCVSIVTPQGWNLSTAVLNQTFSTVSQDSNPYQMFFKPDGLKMYVVGTSVDKVYEYDLSVAWSIGSAVYLQEFDISGQETFARGLFFKPDGLKMYVVGTTNNTVYEYNLGVAWDVTSAVLLQSQAVTGNASKAVFFKSDGLKMYIFNDQSDRIDEYDLSVAWDVTSETLLQNFTITEDATPNSMWFKPDGLKCYVVGDNANIVMEYDLGTAWDVTSMVYLQQISTGTETSPHNLFFKPDGTKMYLGGFVSVRGVIEYDLTS